MRPLFRTAPILSAMVLATTAAPGVSAAGFDGSYVGVSASNGGDPCCQPTQNPSTKRSGYDERMLSGIRK